MALTTLCLTQPLGLARAQPTVSDSHLHLFDFVQESDGVAAALAAMDAAGVETAIVMGMPVVKKWHAFEPVRPGYYLDNASPVYWYSLTDVLVARAILDADVDEAERARLFPFISGFNATDRNAIDHVRRMVDLFPGFWKGIGEIMPRHDDLSAFTYGEPGRADHVALDPVYAFAAARGLPVLLHSNISSVGKHEPLYLHEMKAALARHPETRFIWAHAGISRRVRVAGLTDALADMLAAHANLWLDLSWVVLEQEVAPDGVPAPAWRALIERYPDRFLIGSDAVGRFEGYHRLMERYQPLLKALRPETADAVAQGNLHWLLGMGAEVETKQKELD